MYDKIFRIRLFQEITGCRLINIEKNRSFKHLVN